MNPDETNKYIVNDHRRWAARLVPGSGCEVLLAKNEHGITDGGVPRLLNGEPPSCYQRFVVWRDPAERVAALTAQAAPGELEASVEGWLERAAQELRLPVEEQSAEFRRQCDFSAAASGECVIPLRDLAEWFFLQGWGALPAVAEVNPATLTGAQEERVRLLYDADYHISPTDWRTEIRNRRGMVFHREFPHVFLINLETRPDRLEKARRELAREGIVAELLTAINGDRVRRLHTYDRPGAYALALRMRLVIRRALREGWDSVFFLEDDVVLAPDLQERLKRVELPADWDMFYLGGIHTQGPGVLSASLARSTGTTSTHAVGLSRRIFRRVLKATLPPRRNTTLRVTAVDQAFAWMHNSMKAYVCLPNLAWQRPGWSDLEQRSYAPFTDDGLQDLWPGNMEGTWAEQLEAEFEEVAMEEEAADAAASGQPLPAQQLSGADCLEPVQQFPFSRSITRLFHILMPEEGALTAEQEARVEGWRAMHPRWRFVRWRREALPPLEFSAEYHRLHSAEARRMWLRCEILLRYGGICLDPSLECLQPLDGLLSGLGGFFVREKSASLSLAIMGSCPGHSFFRFWLAMARGVPDPDQTIAAKGSAAYTAELLTLWRRRNSVNFTLEDAAAGTESGSLCRNRFAIFRDWLVPVIPAEEVSAHAMHPHAYALCYAEPGPETSAQLRDSAAGSGSLPER